MRQVPIGKRPSGRHDPRGDDTEERYVPGLPRAARALRVYRSVLGDGHLHEHGVVARGAAEAVTGAAAKARERAANSLKLPRNVADASCDSRYNVISDLTMARHFLHNRVIWLGLLIQLISTTSSVAGLVLCVDADGRVAIETRQIQLACCGEVAKARDGSRGGPVLVENDPCADAPLSLPGALSKADSDGCGDVWAWPPLLTPAAGGVAVAVRPHLQLPPRASPPDRTRTALSTVVLLV